MKIAVITLFCREWFRAEAWKQYYDGYKDDVYLHVIVNNGDAADTEKLQALFPESLVLRSETPNMMASYNLALREILRHPEVDAIAQIVNDIRLSPGALGIMYDFLMREPGLAMVSPVLLKKDSDIVDSLGCTIDHR
ncbi:MAG: glycosyltransferase family 2 protein, partial [Bacteroidales bacterium]|nr:glycosyltransferase family 2 protein [Bacteroidales bacterium]